MTHYYDTKIGKIIDEYSDARIDGAIISYIIEKGWDNVKEITDEQIEQLEGNGIMTKEFIQSLVFTAREITRRCDLYTDFLVYIRLYLGNYHCQTTDLCLYKEDVSKEKWKDIIETYDLCEDDAEVSCIELVTVVDGVGHEADY